MLQQQLEEIRNNNYILDNKVNIDSLSSNMLEHIGVTDSYLRDKLIYSTFYHLIKKEYISHIHLQKLLLDSIGEKYLLYKIYSNDEDAVFTRAFTTLLIALIIDADTNHNFLSQNDILNVKDQLILYMNMISADMCKTTAGHIVSLMLPIHLKRLFVVLNWKLYITKKYYKLY